MCRVGFCRNHSECIWRKGIRFCVGILANKQFSGDTKFAHEIAVEIRVVTDYVEATPTPTCA